MAVALQTCSVCGLSLEGLQPCQAQEHVDECLELLMAPTQMSEGEEAEDAQHVSLEEDACQHAQHSYACHSAHCPAAPTAGLHNSTAQCMTAQTGYSMGQTGVQAAHTPMAQPGVHNASCTGTPPGWTAITSSTQVPVNILLYPPSSATPGVENKHSSSQQQQQQQQQHPHMADFSSHHYRQQGGQESVQSMQLQRQYGQQAVHSHPLHPTPHLLSPQQHESLVIQSNPFPAMGVYGHQPLSKLQQGDQQGTHWHSAHTPQMLVTPSHLAARDALAVGNYSDQPQQMPALTAQGNGSPAPSYTSFLCLNCSVATWLSSQGQLHLLPVFQQHEVDELAVPVMTDADLKGLGICCPTIRAQLLRSAAQHSSHIPEPPELNRLCRLLALLPSVAAGDARQSGHASSGDSPEAEPSPQQQQQQQQLQSTGNTPIHTKHSTLNHEPGATDQQHIAVNQQQVAADRVQPSTMHHMFKARPAAVPRITGYLQAAQPEPAVAGAVQLPQQHVLSRSTGSNSVDGAPAARKSATAQGGMDRNQAGRSVSAAGQGHASRISSGGMQGQTCSLRGLPAWHTLPGTRFTVDYFGPAGAKVQGSNGVWILTHFHADHYKGLSSKWDRGRVLCSPVTAQLINTRLKVPVTRIQELAIGVTCEVEGVPLQLVDANHCPGAAMVIAYPPGKPAVLHTGDCRLCVEMQQQPALQALRGKGAVLVLDTTYCDPQYCFPGQQEALAYTLAAVRTELFNPRALVVFGTYTIGKERLFLEVAHTLGKKVYVNKDKMAVLQCCGLTKPYLDLLTTNHLETNLHAVPLHKVNLDGLAATLLSYKGRYNTITGIQPTGWAMQKQSCKGSCGRRIQKGTIILHSVPYSEHSSFKELHEFCAWLQPSVILPSVNNDNGPGTEKMLSLLRQPLVSSPAATAASSKPITAYLKSKVQPSAQPAQPGTTEGVCMEKTNGAPASSEHHQLAENVPPIAAAMQLASTLTSCGGVSMPNGGTAGVTVPTGLEGAKRTNLMLSSSMATTKRQKLPTG